MVLVMGCGRLGRSLLVALAAAGLPARGWHRGEPIPEAELYWLCVPDGAISELARQLPPSGGRIHSAGSLGPELFGEEGAVLHPLMTFPGGDAGCTDLKGVPATLSGSGTSRLLAQQIGEKLGMKILPISGDRRRYHAAATISSSHCSSLFLSAASLLTELDIPEKEARQLLLPLAIESLRRAAEGGAAALTGPTVRSDAGTEAGHLAVLEEEDQLLYRLLRDRILKLRRGLPNQAPPRSPTPTEESS